MYWNDTVTIYNRSTGSDGRITWSRNIYFGCFWKDHSGVSSSSGSRVDTATRLVRIPVRAYVSVGDFVVFGAVFDTINEYASGSRLTDIRKKYPKSFTVSSVHDNTGSGRPFPHAYIEGA